MKRYIVECCIGRIKYVQQLEAHFAVGAHDVAHLVEQFPIKEWVSGSSPDINYKVYN